MKKGRVTISTDENYVEGTKKIAELWGADAVRDCDGTAQPENPDTFYSSLPLQVPSFRRNSNYYYLI